MFLGQLIQAMSELVEDKGGQKDAKEGVLESYHRSGHSLKPL